MKFNVNYVLALLSPLMLVGCADKEDWNYKVETTPKSIAAYEYLNDYKPLKEYTPGFKVTGALTATEYNEKGLLYRIASSNFDELVAGNAMKMASCVSDQGAMDFGVPAAFVRTAAEAGLTVYGHTFAWHSQQPVKWLSKLIEDKELDIDPEQKIDKVDFELDCKTLTRLDWSGCPEAVTINYGTENGIQFINEVAIDPWYSFQYWVVNGISLTPEKKYKVAVELEANGNMDLVLNFKLGDWGGGAEAKITVESGTGFVTKEFEVAPTMASSGIFLQNNEGWIGEYTIKSFKISHSEAPVFEVEKEIFCQTYTDGPFPYYQMGCAPDVIDGSIHFVPTGDWSQFFCVPATELKSGEYVVYTEIKSTKEGAIKMTAQNGWQGTDENVTFNVTLKEGWNVAKSRITLEQGGKYDFILKPETFDATLDLKSVTVKKIVKLNSIPLTPIEKSNVLEEAMTKWIAGMTTATEGKVKAWDLINEAISGGGDVEGNYDLQHFDGFNTGEWEVGGENFFWQDYFVDPRDAAKVEAGEMKDEDVKVDPYMYAPIVERAARAAYAAIDGANPADLKLFINDYNLESDWDANKKVKSLVYWVNKWEAKGKELGWNTKIDGLGTQMHISYYANATTQARKKEAISNMFRIMAETGKLVRISELDMGYVDENGTVLTTSDMSVSTLAAKIKEQSDVSDEEATKLAWEKKLSMEKEMADFYEWIINEYKTIVPAAQQYGICQWCLTDAPAESGWRKGEPVGLWTQDFQRKPTYEGWVRGLSGAK